MLFRSGAAEQAQRRGQALRHRGMAQLRTERAQDFLMRQSRTADETIHFDGFREACRDMLGQLSEETAEQNLFVGRQHVQAQSAIHEQRTVPL